MNHIALQNILQSPTLVSLTTNDGVGELVFSYKNRTYKQLEDAAGDLEELFLNTEPHIIIEKVENLDTYEFNFVSNQKISQAVKIYADVVRINSIETYLASNNLVRVALKKMRADNDVLTTMEVRGEYYVAEVDFELLIEEY